MNIHVKDRRELLIGCGHSRVKQVRGSWTPGEFTNLTTMDSAPEVNPDVLHDLDHLPYPFDDNSFDEIHGYECLEHSGTQGDFRFFFNQFYEFWRILKPGGYFVATVPLWNTIWAWGDPGHKRVITKGSLIFLDKREYEQVGTTPMTDYREYWKGNFQTFAATEHEGRFGFILRAIKEGME